MKMMSIVLRRLLDQRIVLNRLSINFIYSRYDILCVFKGKTHVVINWPTHISHWVSVLDRGMKYLICLTLRVMKISQKECPPYFVYTDLSQKVSHTLYGKMKGFFFNGPILKVLRVQALFQNHPT